MGCGEAIDGGVDCDCGRVWGVPSKVRTPIDRCTELEPRPVLRCALCDLCRLVRCWCLAGPLAQEEIRVAEPSSAPQARAGRFAVESARCRTDGSAAETDGAASMTSESSTNGPQRRTERLADAGGREDAAGNGAPGRAATGESQESDAAGAKPTIPWWLRPPRFRTILPFCIAFSLLYGRVMRPLLDSAGVGRWQVSLWAGVAAGVVILLWWPIERAAIKKRGLGSRREIRERVKTERDLRRH